jgi:hypothetical protein
MTEYERRGIVREFPCPKCFEITRGYIRQRLEANQNHGVPEMWHNRTDLRDHIRAHEFDYHEVAEVFEVFLTALWDIRDEEDPSDRGDHKGYKMRQVLKALL